MEKIFNELNYRNYLENVYVWEIDKDNKDRKENIDKYSISTLQKIVDDTKDFSLFVIDELRKEKDNHINAVFMKIELEDEKTIDSGLHGGWSADTLYNPVGYDSNFWVSSHLLKEFFKTEVTVDFEETEYYDEQTEMGTVMYTPYIFISMKKELFKEYDNMDFDTPIKKLVK